MQLLIKQTKVEQAIILNQDKKILLTIDQDLTVDKIVDFVINLAKQISDLKEIELEYEMLEENSFWKYVVELTKEWL